jgi:hypothetical protein
MYFYFVSGINFHWKDGGGGGGGKSLTANIVQMLNKMI